MKGMKCSIVAALACASTQAAADFRLGAGAEFTTGKYGGTESTHQFYVPFIAKYETGRWAFKATVPYVVVSGPANVVGAGGERVALPEDLDDDDDDDNGGDGERRTEAGLGDVVVSAFYLVFDERKAPVGLDLGVKVKLATADTEKGLGTGENDYSLQADFYKPIGALTAFASLGYRWYGDPPGIPLRDVAYGGLGATYRVSADTSIGIAYDYRPPITQGGGALREASAFWSVRTSPHWRLQIYGIVGFSDASPDAGVGALLEHRF